MADNTTVSPVHSHSHSQSSHSGSTTTAVDSSTSSRPRPPHPKRIRLNLACNNCRRRKVKCDTEQPKCRNCWLRDEECLTTDPRYGGSGGSPDGRGGRTEVRRWATPNGLMPGQNPAATHRNQAYVAKHAAPIVMSQTSQSPVTAQCAPPVVSPVQASPQTPRRPSTIVVADKTTPIPTPIPTPTPATAISWVSRGYHDAETAENADNHDDEEDGNDPGPAGPASVGPGPSTTLTASSYDADVVVNTDDTTPHRVKYMGGSSLQCLAGFVDIFLRRKRLPLVSTAFTSGMRHAEEFTLPLTLTIPPIPPVDVAQTHLSVFFDRVWPLYPVVDRPAVEQDLQHFYELEQSVPAGSGLQTVLTHDDIPGLAVLLAILAIGAGEGDAQDTSDDAEAGLAYITAGFGLVAHLIARPYLRSVQALLLLAVGLRLRARDGQAWYLLGQAVRIAHSIGLHRQIATVGDDNNNNGDSTLRSRVWWSFYALEKMMELETGRPSAISDDEPLPLPPVVTDASDIFPPWVALATILGQISRRLYVQKPASASALLHEIGHLDQQLQGWSTNLPEQLKPGYDVVTSTASPASAVSTAFLALQFYHAQMAILRAAVVFPTRSFAAEVERAFSQGAPSNNKHRLLQAENLCTAAARSTVHRVLDLADGMPTSSISHLLSPTLTFHAAVVLALHILRAPGKRLVRADCELLASATLHLEAQYGSAGQHPGFVRGLATLRTSVAAAVEQHTTTPAASATRERRERVAPPVTTIDLPPIDTYNYAPTVPGMDMAFFDLDGDNMGHLEAFWNAMGPVNFLDPGLENIG